MQNVFNDGLLVDRPLEPRSTISKIVAFVKDLSVSAESKSLRKAGLVDNDFIFTDDAKTIVLNLEAQSLDYQDFNDMKKENGGSNPSTLEMEALFSKYYQDLVKFADDFNKESEKKKK